MKTWRPTELPELLVIEPPVFEDHRGFLLESWRNDHYAGIGIPDAFVQDVHSFSKQGVLRGLHFQHPDAQGKLVRVTRGSVFDVAVDVRQGSPTFGRWFGTDLSEQNRRQLWIPTGFAHGFLALEAADVQYRCTSYYVPGHARAIAWNDPAIGIPWPVSEPALSDIDAAAPTLEEMRERGLLPVWSA